uniref:BURP domain-containing protein n=1 Tax=Kalanchoe fedtschenkoi TaxID=63787 RepID=A0A7N0UIT2_KALFE
LAIAACRATLPSKLYWNSVLPNTPMPQAIRKRWSWIKAGKSGKHTGVGVGKGGVSVSTGHKGKPVYVGVKPGPDSFVYLYAATQDQFHYNPNVALSFLEKEMPDAATFLPRQNADAIPFSSTKFPGILNHFSVQPESREADMLKKTINECNKAVVCHKQDLAYAVVYCHASQTTRAYTVLLLGFDDTSAWNPKHLALQVLKVKPRSVAICHFLPQDHVV